jgi:hypothetical protein
VEPRDTTTGTTPVTIIFDHVAEAGQTTVTTSGSGPPPPSGFKLAGGGPPSYYELATTAVYISPIEMCFDCGDAGCEKLKLFHFEDNDWVYLDSYLGPANDTICAVVDSFSTFAIFEPDILEVEIDIKPGSDPNSINLGSAGSIPVAILSSESFDATTVDPSTVTLEGASVRLVGKGERYLSNEEDTNSDGLVDLGVKILTDGLAIDVGESVAVLEGMTYEGRQIEGQDSINIVP